MHYTHNMCSVRYMLKMYFNNMCSVELFKNVCEKHTEEYSNMSYVLYIPTIYN